MHAPSSQIPGSPRIEPQMHAADLAASAPPQWIQLRLCRSQRTSGVISTKIVFVLDARTDLSPHAHALVQKYGLSPMVVYDSQARRKHNETAVAQFDAGANGHFMTGLRGFATAALAAMTLRITVGSLMAGHHIECKDLNELIGAEEAIREACTNVRGYLEVAESFDGREEVVVF